MVYFNLYENRLILKDALVMNLRLRYINYFFILLHVMLIIMYVFLKCPYTYYVSYSFLVLMILLYLMYQQELKNVDTKVNNILNPIEDDKINLKVRPYYIKFINIINDKYYITKYILILYYYLFFPVLLLSAVVYLYYHAFQIDYKGEISFSKYIRTQLVKLIESFFESENPESNTSNTFFNNIVQSASNKIKKNIKNTFENTVIQPTQEQKKIVDIIKNNTCNVQN